jgi:hypothetical protein
MSVPDILGLVTALALAVMAAGRKRDYGGVDFVTQPGRVVVGEPNTSAEAMGWDESFYFRNG